MTMMSSPPGPPPVGSSNGSLKNSELWLEELVQYFVASKKSLVATSFVWHANEMVAKARTRVEDIASMRARNSFLRQSIGNQMNSLKVISFSLGNIGREVQSDFKAVLQDLDAAHVRIKEVVQRLQTTQVERSIRPQEEQQKYLYDFVDESGVDSLTNTFRKCIDETSRAQNDFLHSNHTFDNDIEAIEDLLRRSILPEIPQMLKNTASTFRSLESHAANMAQELESLIRHYDFCMTALRHTEGGGEAVQKAKVDLPAGIPVESFHQDVVPAPISADEKAEMMSVLQNDAAEVEGAVQEIRDHSNDMESELEQVTNTFTSLTSEHDYLMQSMKLLTAAVANLSTYIQASSELQLRWSEQKQIIEEKLEEFEVLREFYDGFLHAFDDLLAEVRRRQAVKGKMDKVVRDAISKLDKLYKDDLEEREAFRLDQGDYLPSDIWPGLADSPPHYELRLVNEPIIAPSPQGKEEFEAMER